MCRSVRCKQCGKTTWAGCGMHVDQVMAGVAESDRCQGHARPQAAARSGANAEANDAKRGLLSFLKR